MALNFPSTPSLNQEYTYGNKTWVWNGTAWKIKTTSVVDTAINLQDGTSGSIPYQSTSGNTAFVSIGTSGQLLVSNGTAPGWSNTVSTLTATGNVIAGNVQATSFTYPNGVSILDAVWSNLSSVSGSLATLTANAASQAGDIAALYANAAVQAGNIAGIQSDITTLYSNAAVQSGNISTLFSNAATQAGDITALYSNAAAQAGNIADLYTNAAVQAGNITALYSNAAGQAGDITALYSNAAVQAGNIATLFSNAAVQAGNIADLYANAAVQAGSIAELFSNAALQSGNIAYLQSDINTLYSNAASQAGAISYIQTNYANTLVDTTFSGNVNVNNTLFVNATGYIQGSEIVTANTFPTYLGNALETVTYLASNIYLTPGYGTYNFGNLASISTFNDYDTVANVGFYSVNDTATSPAWVVNIDFTNITKFNRFVLNINYTNNSGHTVTVDLYNNITLGWDTFTTTSGTPGWYQLALSIIDDVPYINNGNVSARLYHVSTGNTSHRIWVDYVALEQSTTGGQGPRGAQGPTGAQGPAGNITSSTSNTLTITNTTASINTTTGALVVYGGVGVGGNLNVGNDLVVTGNIFATNSKFYIGSSVIGVADNTFLINGVPLISGTSSGTTYSNTNVAAYLTTYSGTIGGNVTIGGNLYVTGNLIAAGNVTTLNTDNLVINDPMIYLAEDNPSDILDIGLVASYTSGNTYQHTGFVRDASDGVWKLFSNVVPEPTTTVDFTNATYSDIKVGNLTANGTANIAGNLYVHAILTDFFFDANGVPLASYGDAQVQFYLANYNGNIIPETANLYSLGSEIFPWGNVYANTITAQYLTTGGTANTGNITGVNYLSAVSAGFSQSVTTPILALSAGGYLTFADGTTQSSAYSNVQLGSYLTTNQIGPYSNANVGAYLTTFSGNIGGNITVANSITANGIYTDNYYYANGTPFSSGSNPGGAANSFQYNNAGSLDGTATLQYFSSNGSIVSNGNVYFGAGMGDGSGSLGLGGQILKSTGTEIQWADYIDPVAMSLVFSGGGGEAGDTSWTDVGSAIYATGNVLVGGAESATNYSNLTVYHTTPSLGYNSGALQVFGGVGLAGNLHIKSLNHIHLGEDLVGAFEFANTPLQISVNSNDFQQVVIQNINSGGSASSDFVATADNGNDSSRYINMGINSSTYNNSAYPITGPNDGYLYVNGGTLVLGTETLGETIIFHTGGTALSNIRVIISDTGLTVNTTTPSTSTTSGALVVNGGLGVAGNVVATTFFGALGTTSQTNITELGTITTGTWNATTLDVNYGGTGATTATGALTNLLPAGAAAGYVLTTGGTGSYYWAAGGGGGGGGGVVGQSLTTLRQANTATAGQTLFTLVGRSYTPGTGQLRVYVDGTRLDPSQYTETSNVSYTLANAVNSGQTVFAEIDAFSTFNNYANLTYASNVGNVAAVGLTVQSAIATLETSKAPLSNPVFSGGITTPVFRATGVAYANAAVAASSTTTGALIVTGGVGVSGNLYAGNLTGTNLTGNISTAAQPSITSLGNLTALSANGTIQTTGIVYGNSGVSGRLIDANIYLPNATTIYSGQAAVNIANVATTTLNIGGATTSLFIGGPTGNTSVRGTLNVISNTTSISSNTGAVQVLGGVGVSGNVTVARSINFANNNGGTSRVARMEYNSSAGSIDFIFG